MLETTQELFTANLRRLREKAGLTQAEFAEKVGYSVRGYQKYEQGISHPTPDVIDAFAKGLGCDPAALVLPENQLNRKADTLLELFAVLPTLNEAQLSLLLRVIKRMETITAEDIFGPELLERKSK